jgi:NCAIR mutase (PurE)-related protein
MDITHLTRLLEAVRAQEIGVNDAIEELKMLPYEDLGYARLDHHRALRTGFPEIVFGASKTPEQIAAIVERLASRNRTVLCSRASEDAFLVVQRTLPHATYHPAERMIVVEAPSSEREERLPGVTVVSAGTSDLPVAEEAALTAEAMGHAVERVVDVGVAGLHRVLAALETLHRSHVVVVVAGMEGALPSVIAGLVDVPVIAVPTSVGYGASFGGLAALLGMLNSCALGMAVVNIDNGLGAGVMAAMINRQACGASPGSGTGDGTGHAS